MRAATATLGVVLLLLAVGCERDPERADAAARAVVPGVETGVARVETLRDVVDGFGRVAAEAEPPEVRDARAQLVDLEARRRLASQQARRLEALGQTVAPRKELEAARAEEASAAAAATRARAVLDAFGESVTKEPLAEDERWVIVRVPQSDAGRVASGATCRLVADAFRDQALAGTLDGAVTYVDPETGTAPVRMRVRDPDHILRPGMSGAVTIDVGPPRDGVVVPTSAVLYDGAQPVVFLAEEEGRYAPHPVQLGVSLDGRVEVTGIAAGARVVTAGGASLLSANRLAAGGGEERGGRETDVVARLVGAALDRRAVVLIAAAVLLITGIWTASNAPLDVFPEFAPPVVEIQAEAPGLAAEDVEALVTTPVERALGGLPDLSTLRSSSSSGLSVVTALFPYSTDPYQARQLVIERLALAADQLPTGVHPAVAPLASALTTILAIGLRGGPDISSLTLRDLADWTIRPRLLAVPGVANVVVYGGGVRQIQITTSPERLWSAHRSLDDVALAAAEADAGSGSGFIDRPGQRLPAWLEGRPHGPADLARAPLPGRDGVPVPLAAVAEVREGPAVPVGDALVDGEPGVLLLVTKQPGVNVPLVTHDVETVLAAIVRALPASVRVDGGLFRQASFVEHAVSNLRRALFVAAILVTTVLLLFLGNFRTALVSVVAIPLSLLGAIAVLRAFDATLNTMVLAGLAIAVGEVVDDAIIDVENVWRRLRTAPADMSARALVLAASVEVRSAVVYATLIVALTFLPVFLLGGLEGALFRPLATAYVLATLTSLLVALTVTPALAMVLLPSPDAREHEPPRIVRALRRRYEGALTRVLKRPAPLIAASALAVAGGLALTPFLRIEFLPEFHETNFVMHMTGAPGVGLAESARVGATVARAVLAVPGVRSVAQQIGRSALAEDAWGPERSELLVRLVSTEDAERVTEAVRARVAEVGGFAFDFKQFLNERIEEILEGTGAAILIHLRGTDLERLEQAGALLAERLAAVPGATGVHAPGALTGPGIRIRPRREALLNSGVSAAVLGRALRAALGGVPVGRILEADRQSDVVLQLATDVADDPARLARLPLSAGGGRVVPLGAVADVELVPLRTAIAHEDGLRTVVVRLDADAGRLQAVAREVARVLATTTLPPGIYAELGGEYVAAREAQKRLLRFGALALVGIFVLLVLDFGSPSLAALTMVNVPLALVGGLVAIVVGAGGHVSLGAIVGFVTVFGITIRNGIVLVAHFRQLEAERGGRLDAAGLVHGAADRLAPIVMTALVTAIALVPLVALGGHAGGEIEQPMALVILGGLVTSTWLNLFVVPLWYARMREATP